MALTRIPTTTHEPLLWEYAESKESTGIVEIDDKYGLYIDGEFRAPRSRSHFPTVNPATEEGRPTSTMRSPRPGPHSRRHGGRCRAPSGPSTCSGSPG